MTSCSLWTRWLLCRLCRGADCTHGRAIVKQGCLHLVRFIVGCLRIRCVGGEVMFKRGWRLRV